MSESITASPLCWPEGQARTKSPKWARFDSKRQRTRGSAVEDLMMEIARLGGRSVILSSNLKLRQDGLPYSSQRAPDDQGIAVYFDLKGKPMCFACDQFNRDIDNIWAIKLTIEAIRGIERWGSSDMMERAFMGFSQLPPPTAQGRHWRLVLNISESLNDLGVIEATYRAEAKKAHPDYGGSADRMAELNAAIEQARAELGGGR